MLLVSYSWLCLSIHIIHGIHHLIYIFPCSQESDHELNYHSITSSVIVSIHWKRYWRNMVHAVSVTVPRNSLFYLQLHTWEIKTGNLWSKMTIWLIVVWFEILIIDCRLTIRMFHGVFKAVAMPVDKSEMK